MIGRTNAGGGGNVFAFIVVTYPEGSVCTCSDGTRTIRAKGTTGSFVFNIPYAATWTVSCTDGEESDFQNIIISEHGQSERIELSYRIPSTYQEVQYLESTGSQYIATLIPCVLNQRIKTKVSSSEKKIRCGFFGGDNYGGTFGLDADSNLIYYASETAKFITGFEVNTPYEMYASNNSCKINGVDIQETTGSGNTFQGNYILFKSGVWMTATLKTRIYYFTILDSSDNVLHDLIPCYRKSDNIAGMWDRISKTFLINNGTGTFLVGPDLN